MKTYRVVLTIKDEGIFPSHVDGQDGERYLMKEEIVETIECNCPRWLSGLQVESCTEVKE